MFASRLSIAKYQKIIFKKSMKLLNGSNNNFSSSQINCDNFKDDKNSDQLNVSLFSIKKTLKLANVPFEDNFTNLKTICPVCESSEKGDVYINKTTGHFVCPSCRYGGKFGLIEKFFTATRSPKAQEELKVYQKLFKSSKEVHQRQNDFDFQSYEETFLPITDEMTDGIFQHFNFNEKIAKSTLTTLNARFNPSTKQLLFPLTDVVGQIVGCKILTKNDQDQINEQTFQEQNCSGVLSYDKNVRQSKDKEISSRKAIVVLNVHDILALSTTRINASYVCLPHGLKNLPQECLPFFERFDELVLWFNYNTAGWDVAKNFAKKLGEKRCKFVRPTTSQPTPYRALTSQTDIKAILNKSQPILHKAITTFSSLRQDVLSDLQNIDKVQGVKWKRYPSLNKYLKGHRKGELTVLTGPTGCGKTTFMSEYSLDLAMQGVNTLWGSFEIRNARLATTLLRQFAGKPLLANQSDESLLEFENFANEFESLPLYFMTFHGEQAIKVVMEAIEHAQYVHDINHVIIDNVQFMMGVSDEAKHMDRFWKQDAIIASFRAFATKKNCHVTLVIHPRKEREAEDLTTSSIFGGAKATQEADNVLIIQDKRLTSVRGKKYLQIAKNRYSGDLGILPLDFDKQSLSYAQKTKKKSEDNQPTSEDSPSSQHHNNTS